MNAKVMMLVVGTIVMISSVLCCFRTYYVKTIPEKQWQEHPFGFLTVLLFVVSSFLICRVLFSYKFPNDEEDERKRIGD